MEFFLKYVIYTATISDRETRTTGVIRAYDTAPLDHIYSSDSVLNAAAEEE